MKKILFVSFCFLAIIVTGVAGVRLFSSAERTGNDLLLENVEALAENESDVELKKAYMPSRTCTCYKQGAFGKEFCNVAILSVREYECVTPYNCNDVSETSCVGGCGCW